MNLTKVKELVDTLPDEAAVPKEITAGDIKKMLEIIVILTDGLREIQKADAGTFIRWQEKEEAKGNDVGDWDWFSHLAQQTLNKAQELSQHK